MGTPHSLSEGSIDAIEQESITGLNLAVCERAGGGAMHTVPSGSSFEPGVTRGQLGGSREGRVAVDESRTHWKRVCHIRHP